MKRIEGRCLTAPPLSVELSDGWVVLVVVVVEAEVVAGVGPVLLRTCSWGWAVSERVRVMVSWGEAGGESAGGLWGWASVVWRRDRGSRRGRGGCWEEGEGRAGEAGGVCVEARGRARWREASSRVWSGGLAECR